MREKTNELFLLLAQNNQQKVGHSLPSGVLYNGKYSFFNGSQSSKKLLINAANVRPCNYKSIDIICFFYA